MKRVYDVQVQFKLNDEEWRETSYHWNLEYLDPEEVEKKKDHELVITDWEKVVQLVQDDTIPNARVERTWIFRKPFLVLPSIKYCCEFSCNQKAFKSLKLRIMRKPFKGSLTILEKQLDAEVYCEYLRDRGIPIVRG
jgi:hypothetical protein